MATDVFTSSGSWLCPSGVTSVSVEAWAGGGTGGSSGLSRAGGSGGYYCKKNAITVTPGNSYSVTVGGSDNPSYWADGSLVYACAGLSPAFISECTPVGDVIYAGGSGGSQAGKGSSGGGGGGGSGGTGSVGNNGSPNSGSTGGAGATAVTGGGGGGAGGTVTSSPNGVNGSIPGGGGGGKASDGSSAGAGGRGEVWVTYTSGNSFSQSGSGSLLFRGLATARTTGTFNTLGSILFKGLATPKTSGVFFPQGQLLLAGLAVPKTGAIFAASGSLSFAGVADGSYISSSYSYEGGGAVGNVSNIESDTQVSGIFFGSGKAGTVTTPETIARVGGVFNVGGLLGSVTSPQGGSPKQGFVFFGSGLLGHATADNDDAEQGEGGGEGGEHSHNSDAIINGLHYHFEDFVRCCDRPPLIDCCGCDGPDDENLMPTIWEIQEAPHMYGAEMFAGWKTAWGCEEFDREDVRRLSLQHGPNNTYPEPIGNCFWYTEPGHLGWGKCCELGCGEADCSTVGHGGPECFRYSITAFMGCYKYAEVVEIPDIHGWHLDCGCDELWCADSEWGSYEDCIEFDAQEFAPCHCCDENGQNFATLGDCNAAKAYYESIGLTCGECEDIIMFPGTPGHPAYVSRVAGFSGPCGCGRGYIFLNPDDYACATLLEDLSGADSDLPEYQCNGCNTYVLYKYRPPGEDNPECLSCIKDGADAGCQCGYDAFGFYSFGYGCCGQPAVIELCPASTRDGLSDYGSDCNPDVLCCAEEAEEGMGMAPLAMAAPVIPENSLHFEFLGTSSAGYLIQGEDGKYRGGIPPLNLVVDREARTLNGKPLSMLSEEIFWGRARIGSDVVGFTIEVSE